MLGAGGIAIGVSKRHQQRFAELSNGTHTIDIGIYRQAEDALNPQTLAAGELTLAQGTFPGDGWTSI